VERTKRFQHKSSMIQLEFDFSLVTLHIDLIRWTTITNPSTAHIRRAMRMCVKCTNVRSAIFSVPSYFYLSQSEGSKSYLLLRSLGGHLQSTAESEGGSGGESRSRCSESEGGKSELHVDISFNFTKKCAKEDEEVLSSP
jgi:hypothetical protein